MNDAAVGVRHARQLLLVLAIAALLRLLHIGNAMRSPLTYNPGPDEDFYLQFAAQVAEHGLSIPVEFAFMDPLYGFMAGALFSLTGTSVFALYLLQSAVDVGTAAAIYLCGRELGRERAGLFAAALYALCATAIMFAATALKATWVAAYVAWWSWLALRALVRPTPWRWWAVGLVGGIAVGLRSNLLLLALLALLLLPLVAASMGAHRRRLAVLSVGTTLALLIGLLPWTFWNVHMGLGPTPVPYNGGIVLHHLYNASNPEARSIYPDFVARRHPLEIWHGYRREAERRIGHDLDPAAVSAYWRGEAVSYIAAHPGQSLNNALRKLAESLAPVEVPNNRSLPEEVRYSSVLAALPAPFPWLLALGVPGLALLFRHDRRALILLAPLATCFATMAVFFPEDRFRFHALPALALGAGVLLDRLPHWRHMGREGILATATALGIALLTTAVSHQFGKGIPPPRVQTSREAWGYLRMGEPVAAERLAHAALANGENDPGLHELLGAIAASKGKHARAIAHFRSALAAHGDSHGLLYHIALSQHAVGAHSEALDSITLALALASPPEYQQLRADLLRRIEQDCATLAAASGPLPEHCMAEPPP
jgi:4-amino-4-deoxy-L-arabinose transferase-like glycosyltransferase